MPKIYLKPNSAEYLDETAKPHRYTCDMPGCGEKAEHRAPKDRSLNEHYRFCLQHVQDYNKAWDYFSGMAARDIEDHIIRSGLWDRPTWRFESYTNLEDDLKHKAWQTYNYSEADSESEENTSAGPRFAGTSPEYEALAIMGLTPPVDLAQIKTRYKDLAKKHHPDLNRNDLKAEELLKRINMAYTILRLAYETFETLSKETDTARD